MSQRLACVIRFDPAGLVAVTHWMKLSSQFISQNAVLVYNGVTL